MNEQKKSGRGCLFYGAIAGGILLTVMILALFLGYRYAKNLINEFTDLQPAPLPTVSMSSEEIRRVRERIDNFSRAVNEHRPVEPLIVTADEINAMIENNPQASDLKGHVYVTLESNRVNAQVSIPTDRLGMDRLRGRYFNATGVVNVSLRDGLLWVQPESFSAKGKPVPENVMRQMRAQNFAKSFNEDPKSKVALDKLQDIQITDGKLVITPKKNP